MSKARERAWERRQFWRRNPRLIEVLRRHPDAGRIGRDEAIQRACKEFALDPKKSTDRNLLLCILADILFGKDTADGTNALAPNFIPEKKAGRPQEWTPAKKRQFQKAILRVVGDDDPWPSWSMIASRLERREGISIKADTLEKRLHRWQRQYEKKDRTE